MCLVCMQRGLRAEETASERERERRGESKDVDAWRRLKVVRFFCAALATTVVSIFTLMQMSRTLHSADWIGQGSRFLLMFPFCILFVSK